MTCVPSAVKLGEAGKPETAFFASVLEVCGLYPYLQVHGVRLVCAFRAV